MPEFDDLYSNRPANMSKSCTHTGAWKAWNCKKKTMHPFANSSTTEVR